MPCVGMGRTLPVPEYDPEKASSSWRRQRFPMAFDLEWYVPFPPTSTLGERISLDLPPWHSEQDADPGGGRSSGPRCSSIAHGLPFGANRHLASRTLTRGRVAKGEHLVSTPCAVGPSSFILRTTNRGAVGQTSGHRDLPERDAPDSKRSSVFSFEEYYFVPIYVNPLCTPLAQSPPSR